MPTPSFMPPTQPNASTLVFPYRGFQLFIDMGASAPALRIEAPSAEDVTLALMPSTLAHPSVPGAASASAQAMRTAMLNIDVELLRQAACNQPG